MQSHFRESRVHGAVDAGRFHLYLIAFEFMMPTYSGFVCLQLMGTSYGKGGKVRYLHAHKLYPQNDGTYDAPWPAFSALLQSYSIVKSVKFPKSLTSG